MKTMSGTFTIVTTTAEEYAQAIAELTAIDASGSARQDVSNLVQDEPNKTITFDYTLTS